MRFSIKADANIISFPFSTNSFALFFLKKNLILCKSLFFNRKLIAYRYTFRKESSKQVQNESQNPGTDSLELQNTRVLKRWNSNVRL